jgi:hypothetical protein
MGQAARNRRELDLEWAEQIEKRIRQLETRAPKTIRRDAADGAHVIFGEFDDGSVGVRVYDNTGALVHDLTAT